MADRSGQARRRLIDLLPSIYQEPGPPGHPNSLPRFLNSFERVLWGEPEQSHDPHNPRAAGGLAGEIARLNEILDPWQAREEFLPWLAAWMSLTLRSNLRVERKRALIANMIPLYRIRGTRKYLEELLRICVDAPTAVEEEDIPPLQVGVHSTLGVDTYLGGGAPHFFRIRMIANKLSAVEMEDQRQLAYEVVELAKPAHTGYEFRIDSPQLQIAVHSTVGIDTVLGPAEAV